MKIEHDPSVAAEMERMIDPTSLVTVRRYVQDPNSQVDKVILVQGNHSLAEVAAAMTSSNVNAVFEMVSGGAVKFGVETPYELATEYQDCGVLLGSYPEKQYCNVVYLPPFYIVKIEPGKLYE